MQLWEKESLKAMVQIQILPEETYHGVSGMFILLTTQSIPVLPSFNTIE